MTDSPSEPTPDVHLATDTTRRPDASVDGAVPTEPVHGVPGTSPTPEPDVDLDAVERDLAGVEQALERLSNGTYWTDEVTGEPIPEQVLAADPTARRA